MKKITKEQQRFLLRLWDKTGPELERIRREELRGSPYKWEVVDSLLEIGDYCHAAPRLTSGLVEMQKSFMELARKQGQMHAMVRESPVPYGKSALPACKPVRGGSKLRSSRCKKLKQRSKN